MSEKDLGRITPIHSLDIEKPRVSLLPDRRTEAQLGPLQESSDNILKTLMLIKEDSLKSGEARRLLSDLLRAREDYYYVVASNINPGIERVDEFLYKFGQDERPLYGSIVSLLDTSPKVADHKPLVDAVKIELPGNKPTLIGEDVLPEFNFGSSVVISGSSAEKRTRPYAGDFDLAEFVTFRANNIEHGAALLARGIQDSGLNSLKVISLNGEHTEIHLETIRVGQYDVRASEEDRKNRTIPWQPFEIRRGYKTAIDINGESYQINLSDVCRDPVGLRFEYLVTSGNTATKAEKVIFVDGKDPSGNTLIDNSKPYTYAFDQVYFDDPTPYGLGPQVTDPDSFINYIGVMLGQMERSRTTNTHVYCQRLYKVLKVIGDLQTANELVPVFRGAPALLHQLAAQYQPTQRAISLEIIDATASEKLTDSMIDILKQPDLQHLLSPKDLRILSGESNVSSRRIRDLAFKVKTLQADEVIRGLMPNLSPTLQSLLQPT